MAENRSFDPTTPQANRAAEQGLGVGQKEMNAQRDPGRDASATAPRRSEPFAKPAARPPQRKPPRRDGRETARAEGDETLGEGTPANVDIHDLGQRDRPEEDWGEPPDEGATYSANHGRRPVKTEADRGQGRKTRAAQKAQITRRT